MKRSHASSIYLTLAAASLFFVGCGKTGAPAPVAAKTPIESPKPAEDTATPAAAPADSPTFVKPEHVRGIYLTAWSAGSKRKIDNVLAMFKRTDLNSVVIDVRDGGEMYLKMGIPLADEAKATMVAIPKPKELMKKLAAAGVYPIARIACFRDNYVPKVHPELAVQLDNGKVWKDRSGHTWLDPYNQKNWDYIGKTIDFALGIGFPEIQLDYVRFPSEGKSSTQVFPGKKTYKDPKALPEDVIKEFAEAMRDKVKAGKGTISADIFGIISSTRTDQGIGQELEKIAAPFDLVSPMVYPSHFHKGEYGIKDPNADPYLIVLKSLKDYRKRLPGKTIRPWLQDFSLGRHYTAEDVKAQIKAAADVGYNDYLIWNAGNRYTESAYAKESAKSAAAKPDKGTSSTALPRKSA